MRITFLMVFLALLAACGGSGGGAPSQVTVSGKATYQDVPHDGQGGLDYAAASAEPIRGATLQVIDTSDDSVLATATTSDSGDYRATVPGGRDVRLRVRAELKQTGTPSWDVRVVDNTSDDALYVLDSDRFRTDSDVTRDVHAPSGWDAGQQAYTSARSAAPFSVLDNIYQAMRPILAADPDAAFPALVAHWSEDNITVSGDESAGEIGTTFYRNGEIFVLGQEDEDTDEYDDHVIQHEWAHYFEDQFSRSDSLGGSHSFFVRLDPRVAFSEGFANAYSGIGTGRSLYEDSGGTAQSNGIAVFDMEDNDWSGAIPDGWFNEGSIHSVVYDLFDDAPESGFDGVAEGFGPIFGSMTGKQTNTPASAIIYPFVVGMKTNASASDGDIDTVVESRAIRSSDNDQWGGTEDNDAGAGSLKEFKSSEILPVHTLLDTSQTTSVEVCAIRNFGVYNTLSNRRFVQLAVKSSGSYTIQVSISSTTSGADDPDFVLYRDGETIVQGFSEDSGSETSDPVSLDARSYVLEVYPYSYVNQDNSGSDDDTCLLVEVT